MRLVHSYGYSRASRRSRSRLRRLFRLRRRAFELGPLGSLEALPRRAEQLRLFRHLQPRGQILRLRAIQSSSRGPARVSSFFSVPKRPPRTRASPSPRRRPNVNLERSSSLSAFRRRAERLRLLRHLQALGQGRAPPPRSPSNFTRGASFLLRRALLLTGRRSSSSPAPRSGPGRGLGGLVCRSSAAFFLRPARGPLRRASRLRDGAPAPPPAEPGRTKRQRGAAPSSSPVVPDHPASSASTACSANAAPFALLRASSSSSSSSSSAAEAPRAQLGVACVPTRPRKSRRRARCALPLLVAPTRRTGRCSCAELPAAPR